jgi:hypothetical protein
VGQPVLVSVVRLSRVGPSIFFRNYPLPQGVYEEEERSLAATGVACADEDRGGAYARPLRPPCLAVRLWLLVAPQPRRLRTTTSRPLRNSPATRPGATKTRLARRKSLATPESMEAHRSGTGGVRGPGVSWGSK